MAYASVCPHSCRFWNSAAGWGLGRAVAITAAVVWPFISHRNAGEALPRLGPDRGTERTSLAVYVGFKPQPPDLHALGLVLAASGQQHQGTGIWMRAGLPRPRCQVERIVTV